MRERLRTAIRWLIGLGGILGILLAMGLLGSLCFYGWLRTESGNRWVASRMETSLNLAARNGTVTLGGVQTNLQSHVVFTDFEIKTADGKTVVYVGRGQTAFSLFALMFRDLELEDLQLDSVLVDVELGEDGVTDIGRVFGQEAVSTSAEPWEGLPVEIRASDARLNGVHIVVRTPERTVVHATGVQASADIEGSGTTLQFRDIVLQGQLAAPGPSVVSARGDVVYSDRGVDLDRVTVEIPDSEVGVGGTIGRGEVDVHLDVRELHLPALEPIINNPGLAGTYSGEVTLQGPVTATRITGQLAGVEGTLGTLTADAQANLSGEKVTWTAELSLEGMHIDQLYPAVTQAVVLDGEATLNGRGIRFPDDFDLTVAYRGSKQNVFGQKLDSVQTTFAIQNGELTIESGHLLGILGELQAIGDIDLVEGPMSLHITGWAHPDRLEALGITGIRSSGWVDARLTGNLKEADAIYNVAGSIRFRSFQYMEDVRFEDLVARFNVAVDGLDIRGHATVKGKEGETYGLKIGAMKIRRLNLTIPQGGTLRFGGDITVRDVAYPDTLTVEEAIGRWTFENSPSGTQATHADLTLGPHTLLEIPGTSGAVVADVVDDDVAFDVELEDGRRPILATRGRYDLATAWTGLDRLSFAPTPRSAWDAIRPVHFTTIDGGIANADIAVTGNLGTFEVTGTLATRGPLDGRVTVDGMQMDLLAELYPDDYTGLAGTVEMDLTVTGEASNPKLSANFELADLWMEDAFRWLDVSGSIRADRDNLWPEVTVAVADDELARIGGRVSVSLDLADPRLSETGDIDLEIGIRAGEIDRLKNLIPWLDPMFPSGKFSAQVHCTGQATDPDFRFGGTTEIDISGWDDPARFEYELTRDKDSLTGWADVRDGMDQRMNLGLAGTTRLSEIMAWTLTGAAKPDLNDYTLYLDDMFVSGALLGFPADSLAAALGVPIDATGNVVGGFTAWGSPYTPQGEGGFHWVEATIGNVSLEGALISVSPAEEGYQLDIHSSFLPEGELSITGNVPIAPDLHKDWTEWSTGELALSVSGDGIPLGIASGYDPGIDHAEGLLKINGTVVGNPTDPSPFLTASIDGGAFTYRPLGLNIHDLSMDFTSSNGTLSLDTLHFVTQPRNLRGNLASGIQDLSDIGETSTVDVSGTSKLGERSLGEIDAAVRLGGGAWIINTPQLAMRADGEIDMRGTWPAIVVDGDISLFSGKVILDAASFLTAAPLATDRSLTIHRDNAIRVRPPTTEIALYDDFDVTLRVNMNRNLELDMSVPFIEDMGIVGAAVSRADLSARIGGSATAQLANGALRMNGNVDLLDGRIRVLQARFNLQEGSMFFTGADPYNPIMDIHAQMKIPDATVDLFMTGTPEEPVIDLSSKEFPDKTQMLTILLTGSAPDELASNINEMPEVLASLLVSSIFAGKSLGNFSIEPDGSVRAGAPITNNIFAVTILSPTANIDENHVALEVEWGPAPKVIVSGGIGDTVSFADIFWEVRF